MLHLIKLTLVLLKLNPESIFCTFRTSWLERSLLLLKWEFRYLQYFEKTRSINKTLLMFSSVHQKVKQIIPVENSGCFADVVDAVAN